MPEIISNHFQDVVLEGVLTNHDWHSSSGSDQRRFSLYTRRFVGQFWRVLERSGEEGSGDILSDFPIKEVIDALEQVMINTDCVSSAFNSALLLHSVCSPSSSTRHQTWAIWKQCSGGVPLNLHTACCMSLPFCANEK